LNIGIRFNFKKRRKLLISLLFLLVLFWVFWNILPDSLFNEPYSAVLLSRENYLLGAIIASDQQWRFPQSEKLPDKYKEAVIQFEDRRFYYHIGVDPIAIGRAIISNIKSGKKVSGASTLSMQVMRLSRKNRRRTYFEKLKEIILAIRLELKYSKNEILSFYAAHAPFGSNIVGLDAASWFYFNRNPKELSWAESAMLAVLPNSPALMHPGKNRNKLILKRNNLLRKLNDKKIITDLQLNLALSEPLPKKMKTLPRLAPHLLDSLMKNKTNGKFYKSTIKIALQKRVIALCNEYSNYLRLKGINNLSSIIIDNRSAEIISYIGNTGLNIKRNIGQEVDINQSPRSTGSILKPFLYAAMLSSGEITPNSLIADIPAQYNGFMPENFDHSYRGAVPARQALAKSLNIPAVRMLRQYDVNRFYDFLKQLGMTTLFRTADNYGLTLILGGAEGTLLDITKIYSKFAQVANSKIKKVSKIKIFSNDKSALAKAFPISRGAAYLTLKALLEVSRPGLEGYWKTFNSSRKIAWKTGTSYGLRDAWAVGVTPDFTVGVWAGNASGQGRAGLTGVSVAAPVLFKIFNLLNKSVSWFERPDNDLKKVALCEESGCLPTKLCKTNIYYIPRESNFSRQCSYHHLVHLDKKSFYRVDSRCESVINIINKTWFTLPPIQEFYYQKSHPTYKKLPPYRRDCAQARRGKYGKRTISLIYPSKNTAVYIPIDLDGKRSNVIFKAVHRNSKAIIFWHLDEHYIGQTQRFHQISIMPQPGLHTIILLDEKGNRVTRTFKVLDKTKR